MEELYIVLNFILINMVLQQEIVIQKFTLILELLEPQVNLRVLLWQLQMLLLYQLAWALGARFTRRQVEQLPDLAARALRLEDEPA